ncbi:putative DNA-binding protein RAP1 [[Candida] jaroonii]|uniref:DNA-binding protein RAP1 n=1 Tax=[Candida] jaroonii TaxID=467808 RepID=A0ACA9YF73_9ASCO|nr:putative DNA-binding protein RAP1 [[Candida] jaroonii]
MDSIFKIGEEPAYFYIDKNDENYSLCSNLIDSNGGRCVDTLPSENNSVILLSTRPLAQNSYNIKIITDSINRGRFLPLPQYINSNASIEDEQGPQRKRQKTVKKTSIKYTKEQDDFIIEEVRKNPLLRGSQGFYQGLAKAKELMPHPPNSIRSRFRNFLKDRLEYIYKVDTNGELATDGHGNLIKVGLEDLPDKKTKFTATDDYLLCTKALEWANERKAENPDLPINFQDPKPPVSFFKDNLAAFTNHSDKSWRDRYRKFASKKGIQNYIAEYDRAKASGLIPQPMRNMTRRYVKAESTDKKQLEDLKQTIGSMAAIKPPRLAEVDDDIDDSPDSNLLQNNQSIHQFADIPIDSQLITDSQLDIGIDYVPKGVRLEELIDNKIFDGTSEELLESLDEVCSQESISIPSIFNRFNEIGLKYKLTSHIIKATSGDLSKIKLYNRCWISKTEKDKDEMENPYNLFNIYDVPGIWNLEYDRLLNNDTKLLAQLHGSELIKARIEFLQNLDQLEAE